MAKFPIYSKDGSYIRYVGEPTYNGAFLGVPYLSFANIESITPIDWQRGDCVDYHRTGLRYKLYSAPEPIKQARRDAYGASFVYQNVRFYSAVKDLEIAPFRDLVPEDNDIHFSTRPEVSTFENVYGIAARIQECIDDIFPNQWEIRVFNTNDEDLLALFNEQKEYSVSNGSCLDALSKIYDTWKNVGWFHTYNSNTGKNVITIGRSCIRDAENTSEAYAYGLGKGLKSLKKVAANEEFATRLYVYGSDRNIQTRYYNGLDIHDKDSVNIANLMLPLDKWGKTNGKPDARKAYLQADDALIEKYGLIPRTVYFDGSQNEEIYPSITGLTSFQVRQAMIDAGHGDSPMLPNNINDYKIDQFSFVMFTDDIGDAAHIKANPTWEATVLGVGFDIAEQGKLTENGYATISMKSGECAGREFKVKKSKVIKDGQTLTIERTWDESLGMGFPNKHYSIKSGDQFVLLDVPMPDYYITLAQNRLLAAGEKMLADYTRVSAYYEPSLDPIKIKAGGKLLREGIYLQIYDEDIIDTDNNRDYVLIDTLTIDEKGALPTYRVTLRDQKRASKSFDVLEDMIEDAKESTEKDIQAQKTYTDRRFRSAQETIEMLQEAFTNFSEGINPVTVQTMAMLVGDESLQFRFTSSLSSLVDIPCPLSYDLSAKQLRANGASLIHMTLGIDSITTKGSMAASDYLGWNMPFWDSPQFDVPESKYYVYAKVPKTKGTTGEYVLSESPIGMTEVSGYYHLLIGILNSEYNGTRDFVTLYGFTEVLPGQITTDILRSSSGNLVIDLLNAIITATNGATIQGAVKIEDGSLMSSRVDVGDETDTDPVAFMNGGMFGYGGTGLGKLVLAAGIPTTSSSGSTALETRSKEAKTRIYEQGKIVTKQLEAKGGVIGGVSITEDGLSVTKNGRKLSIDSDGFNYGATGKRGAVNLDACDGDSTLFRIDNSADGRANYCPSDRKVALMVAADDTDPAIESPIGQFYGLRPRIRRITASTTNIDLLEIDHTITIYGEGTKYVNLPPNGSTGSIITGQVYKIVICHNAATVVIDSGTTKMWDLKAGGNSLTEFTVTGYNVVDIIYDGNNWFLHTAH